MRKRGGGRKESNCSRAEREKKKRERERGMNVGGLERAVYIRRAYIPTSAPLSLTYAKCAGEIDACVQPSVRATPRDVTRHSSCYCDNSGLEW